MKKKPRDNECYHFSYSVLHNNITDLSSQIALEAISENPNLNYSWMGIPPPPPPYEGTAFLPSTQATLLLLFVCFCVSKLQG